MADRPRALTRQDAEDFLYREAALLDEGRLDEWLALFTDDGRYRLPIASGDDELEPALVDDDRERLAERVFRLTSTQAHAQLPPSQTVHDVHNVQVEPLTEDEVLVRCTLTVHEVRVGGPEQVGLGRLRVLPGRAVYELRLGPPLRIRSKTVYLLERELPLQNIAFIV
jgi:3-phenylpropionate/cinnamic acid dioxygenase small subunit